MKITLTKNVQNLYEEDLETPEKLCVEIFFKILNITMISNAKKLPTCG